MKTSVSILLLAVICLIGCGKRYDESPMQSLNTPLILKVSVSQTGRVSADGVEITLGNLDARLAHAKVQNGVVWYYREDGQGEPPAVAMEVINLIVKHRLPVTLSSKPDFSDTIGQDGISRPRK